MSKHCFVPSACLHPAGCVLVLLLTSFFLLFTSLDSIAQADTSHLSASLSPQNISGKSLNAIDRKYGTIQKGVEGQTQKALAAMQKKESSLYAQLKQKDSATAEQLFGNAKAKYAQLTAALKNPGGAINSNLYKQYFPSVDSAGTVMKYLGQASAMQGAGAKLQKIQAISSKMTQLQNTLQGANLVQNFISQREQQLQSQLTRYGMAGQLIGVNKQAYYYQQQMMSYKSMLDDKQKLEETLLAQAQQFPGFQSFWQKNSYLAAIFPMNSANGAILPQAGLQQKAQIGEMVTSQINSSSSGGGQSPLGAIQAQFAEAKSKLQSLKDKAQSMDVNSGWNSNMTMPNFTPNSQHNKSFLKRLEFGFNIQNTGVTNYLPNISTLGVMLGYKVSDKVTVGVGASYLVGLGNGIQQISLSNQGVGARSFIDVEAKGTWWITGGYEYSYMEAFARLADIRNLTTWQKSALIGITKKYMIGRKTANVQLLYNLLYKTDNPQGTPLNFRIGYSL
jgi:hypothetical protein